VPPCMTRVNYAHPFAVGADMGAHPGRHSAEFLRDAPCPLGSRFKLPAERTELRSIYASQSRYASLPPDYCFACNSVQ
jgi:hypothetical protein